MTDAPTTRETAEESLDDLLARAVEHVKAMTPEEREAMHDRQKKAWVAAEMAICDEGTRVVTGHQETADHAELGRMAEAAAPYWHAANLACGGNPIAVDLVAPFVGAMSPTVCSDLLSEIAALRGERDGLIEAAAARNSLLEITECQRDELRKALEEIADEAPYRSGYCQSDVEYGPALSADEMQAVARQALANQGAEQ